jgi:BirA family biotin operon repressor/biotin-[acetyl-CoA-carboxylase] ligase
VKFDIRRLETTASTNDDAKQAAESGAAEGLVIWALQQSAGRARQGRQWHSPAGNLTFSVLLRPKATLRDYGRYSFVAALAIYDAVRVFLPDALIELKWPNDVLVNGKKISGILLEAGAGQTAKQSLGVGWLVVGIGLNVQHVPEKPLYPVTSLAAEKAVVLDLDLALDRVLKALASWCDIADSQGFAPIRAAWITRARKGMMRVRLPREEIYGQFADLDAQGNLRLLMADGSKRLVNAGDVFF